MNIFSLSKFDVLLLIFSHEFLFPSKISLDAFQVNVTISSLKEIAKRPVI